MKHIGKLDVSQCIGPRATKHTVSTLHAAERSSGVLARMTQPAVRVVLEARNPAKSEHGPQSSRDMHAIERFSTLRRGS